MKHYRLVMRDLSNKITVFFLNTIVLFFFLISIPQIGHSLLEDWCSQITVYLLFLFIFQYVSLKIIMPPRRFLILVIIVLFYLFMFSHIVLTGLGFDFSSVKSLYVFNRNSYESVTEATVICVKGIIFIYFGILLYYIICKEHENRDKTERRKGISLFTRLFFILFGLVFDLVYNIMLYFTSKIGYGEVATATIPYMFRICSYFLISGICICISDPSIPIKKKKKIIFAFIVYKLFTMITGVRAYALICIIIVSYIYYCKCMNSKLRIREILIFLVIIQVFGGLLVGIREVRNYDTIRIADLFEYMFGFKYNIMFELMSEFGITLNVIITVIRETGLKATNGSQFVASLLSVVPGIRKIVGLDFDAMEMDSALNLRAIGGSYFADILFDAGSFFPFFCVLLGLVLAFVYEKYEQGIRKNNLLLIGVSSPILIELTFCVRSTMSKIPRMATWYAVLFFLLCVLFNKKRKVRLRLYSSHINAYSIPVAVSDKD